jgi:hypothetical protein
VPIVLNPVHACSLLCARSARRLLAPVLLIGAALSPGRAHACGANPTPSYTIAGVTPSEGSSAVARDAGIVITGIPSLQPGGVSQFAEVELFDADTEESVPLRSIAWYSLVASDETLALHPTEPLAPQHSYRVEATPIDLIGDGSQGPVFVTRFTTSSALLEPLVLSGELGLSLRGGDVDLLQYGPCGENIGTGATRRALLVDVQLPAPSGGQGIYRGKLHFSDHSPARVDYRDPAGSVSDGESHDVNITHFLKLEAGEALTLQQEFFEESSAYAGCFTFVVWDPAGHVAETSTCLPSLSADDIRDLATDDAPLPLSSDEDIATQQVRQEAADRREQALGCAFGASPTTTSPAWIALLLSFLARSRSRQRR